MGRQFGTAMFIMHQYDTHPLRHDMCEHPTTSQTTRWSLAVLNDKPMDTVDTPPECDTSTVQYRARLHFHRQVRDKPRFAAKLRRCCSKHAPARLSLWDKATAHMFISQQRGIKKLGEIQSTHGSLNFV